MIDITLKAIDSLIKCVDNTKYNTSEKEALKIFLNKLRNYYIKEMNIIENKKYDYEKEFYRKNRLKCLMTELLVEINDCLNQEIDVFYFISVISTKIANFDNKKSKKKVKKLS